MQNVAKRDDSVPPREMKQHQKSNFWEQISTGLIEGIVIFA